MRPLVEVMLAGTTVISTRDARLQPLDGRRVLVLLPAAQLLEELLVTSRRIRRETALGTATLLDLQLRQHQRPAAAWRFTTQSGQELLAFRVGEVDECWVDGRLVQRHEPSDDPAAGWIVPHLAAAGRDHRP